MIVDKQNDVWKMFMLVAGNVCRRGYIFRLVSGRHAAYNPLRGELGVRFVSYAPGNPATLQEIGRRRRIDCLAHLSTFLTEHGYEGKEPLSPQRMVVEAAWVCSSTPALHNSLTEVLRSSVDLLDVCTFSTKQLLYLVNKGNLGQGVNVKILDELLRRDLLPDDLVTAFISSVNESSESQALAFWASLCAKRHELNAEDKSKLRQVFLHPYGSQISGKLVAMAVESDSEEARSGTSSARFRASQRHKVWFSSDDMQKLARKKKS